MKAMTIIVIVIAALVLATGLWYTKTQMAHPAPESTETPTPTAPTATTPTATPTRTSNATPIKPAATVTADLSQKVVDTKPYNGDYELFINGTVTNDSPNTAYGVGLHVFALADAALNPFEVNIDVTVPVASGTYDANSTYGLSTIPPNQNVATNIEIILPLYAGEFTVAEHATVTIVWSNTPQNLHFLCESVHI